MEKDLLKSFDPQKELNPKVWDGKGENSKMKPEIRERLLEIAYEYIDFLDIDIIVYEMTQFPYCKCMYILFK